jgi:hypothetical protein
VSPMQPVVSGRHSGKTSSLRVLPAERGSQKDEAQDEASGS